MSKHELIESVATNLRRTASWRWLMATRHPEDKRNARAAASLERLAGEFHDADISALMPFEGAPRWLDAVGQACRLVEFQSDVRDLDGFVNALVALLNVEVAA